MHDGGFAKWPESVNSNDFHTAYAVHYLTEARDRGYKIPKELMKNALRYLKDFSKRDPRNSSMARVQAYAAYLLARNEIIVTQSLISLEQWIERDDNLHWNRDIVSLYIASAYKIMKSAVKSRKSIDEI